MRNSQILGIDKTSGRAKRTHLHSVFVMLWQIIGVSYFLVHREQIAKQAMEENLLCPFHYFGITDLEIDGEVIDEKTEIENYRFLVSEKRVDYIIRQINFYGFSGDRVKGLVFCSSRKEAEELSKLFNERGYKTKALTGADSQEEREASIELLTKEIQVDIDGTKHGEYLDYIFTVDIFNEGVDIPEV